MTCVKIPLDAPSQPNHTWSLNFIGDTLYSGNWYRVLNVIDEGTREALDISFATSLPAGRVVRVLDSLVAEHGKPNQSAYIERFNRSFRHEVLDANQLRTMGDFGKIAWVWLISYNEERPHAALC